MSVRSGTSALIALTIGLIYLSPSYAGQLIFNGGFEQGFAGWNVDTQNDSGGALILAQNVSGGGTAPFSLQPYAYNPQGQSTFALGDQIGPASFSLSQQFFPTGGPVRVSFDLFASNQASETLPGREAGLGQNVEVEIYPGVPEPFSDPPAPPNLVTVLYGPGADAGPNPNPWTHYEFVINFPFSEATIEFAETNSARSLMMGVDNVSITTIDGVPEPSTWLMMIAGMVGLGFRGFRQSRKHILTA